MLAVTKSKMVLRITLIPVAHPLSLLVGFFFTSAMAINAMMVLANTPVLRTREVAVFAFC